MILIDGFAAAQVAPARCCFQPKGEHETRRRAIAYIDGFVIPVPSGNRDAYLALAKKAASIFLEHGATRVVEAWGDDIKPGKINGFRTAVLAEEDESVIFSFVEWPSKEVRDTGNDKIMADPRMQPHDDLPFSGARLIYGGFTPILDMKAQGR
jgi:uncharacterized protein YbaA (DUF1428 family)